MRWRVVVLVVAVVAASLSLVVGPADPASAHTVDSGDGVNLGDAPDPDGHWFNCALAAAQVSSLPVAWKWQVKCQYDPETPNSLSSGDPTTWRIRCVDGEAFTWSFGLGWYDPAAGGRYTKVLGPGTAYVPPCLPDFSVAPRPHCTNGTQCVAGGLPTAVAKFINAPDVAMPTDYFNGGSPGDVVPLITRPEAELRGHRLTSAYAGDPVNTATGNFVDTVVDLDFPVDHLSWERTYNSRGGAWTTNLSRSLTELADGDVEAVLADGGQATFAVSGSGYTRAEGVPATLAKQGVGQFSLAFDDGTIETYVAGRLASTEGWDGQRVTLGYSGGLLVSAVHNAGYGLTFTYDDGVLVRADATDGRHVTYGWTGGRLTSVGDAGGGVWSYHHDGAGFLDRIVDPDGVVLVDNTYDAGGKVTRQVTPSGETVTFSYGVGSGRTTVTHASTGAATVYQHDARGRVASITDPFGHTVSRSYDAAGNLERIVDRRGAAVTQTFNDRGALVSRSSPEGVNEIFARDDLDRLRWVQTPEGTIKTFTYEGGERLPTTVIDGEHWNANDATHFDVGANGLVRSVTDADGVTLAFGYDTERNLTSVTDEANKATTLGYDGAGNRTSTTTPLGRRTAWTYDGRRRLLTSTDPAGGVVTQAWTPGGRLASRTDEEGNVTSFAYDTAGRLTSVTDGVGNVATYGYDLDGNVTSVARPGGSVWSATYDVLGRRLSETDATGVTVTYGYDEDGNQTTVTDENGGVVRRTFDFRGRLTAVADELGHTTRYGYYGDELSTVTDAVGNRFGYSRDIVSGQVDGMSGPGGRNADLDYSLAGRLLGEMTWNGDQTGYGYDALGRLMSATGPEGGVTRFGHDDDGRVTSVTSPEGLVTTYAYDDAARSVTVDPPGVGATTRVFTARGDLAVVDEPATDPVRFAYDNVRRLSSATDALGRVAAYGYDGRGNVVSRANANGGVDRWTYDLADRLSSHVDPLGHTATTAYDSLGRVRTVTDASGRSVTYDYDAAHRRVSEVWAAGPTITTAYDALGRRTSMSDGASTSSWTWDEMGNLVASASPGGALAYGYDLTGNRTSLTYADGGVATFGYDHDDRLVSVSHPQAGETTYAYDDDGRLLHESLPQNVTRDHMHVDGLLIGYTETRDGFARSTALERDQAGRITKETLAGSAVTSYAYDVAGQLAVVDRPGGLRTTIGYDQLGNRDAVATGLVVDDYAHDLAGRLAAVRHTVPGLVSSTTRFVHDDAGRMTAQIDATGSQTFAYDQRGRLVTAAAHTPAGSSFTERTYDPAGLLARVNDTEVTWDQSYDVPQVATVGDVEQLFGLNGIAALRDGRADVFAHDVHGSVLAVGPAADLAAGVSYDAFGSPTTPTSGVGGDVTFGYRGELHAGGLVHLRAREYQPPLGRFTTVDPLPGVPGDVTVANPYAYAANDPLDKVDPLGLSWRNPCLGSSCFLDGHGALVDTLSDVPTPRQFWNHQRDVGAASVDRFVDQFGEVPTGFDLVNVSLNPGYAAIDRCTDYACGSGAGLDCALSVVDLILTAVGIEQVGVSVGRASVGRAIVSETGAIGGSSGRFVSGQLFETTVSSPVGNVGVLAEVQVIGTELVLRDVAIFGVEGDLVDRVGARTFLAMRDQLAREAAAEGFETLRITGTRVAGSSSAAPGKSVDLVVDLSKYR